MDSTALLFLAAGNRGGGGIDPNMMQAVLKMEEERRQRTNAVIQAVGSNIASGFRFLKGPPKIVDDKGKELSKEDPRFTGIMLAHKVEEDIKFEGLQNLINGAVSTYIAFQTDSTAAMAMMMSGPQQSTRDERPTAGSARFSG